MNQRNLLRGILAIFIILLFAIAGPKYYRQIFTYRHNIEPIFADKATTILDTSNYSFIKDIGLNSNVIAIGESTHGSREVNKIRLSAFKYLVNHCGYTTFLIEGDFGAFLPISNYLETGNGDLLELLHDAGWWIWNTSEMFEIISWMRSYNMDPDNKVKLRFLGVDARGKAKVLHRIISYYKNRNTGVSKPIIAQAQQLIRAKVGSKEHGSLLDSLTASMAKDTLLQRHGTVLDSVWIINLCRIMLAGHYKMYNATSLQERLKIRDAVMADNIIYITRRGYKSVFAAHMMHIRKDTEALAFGLLKRSFAGTHLQQALNDRYYALYVDFALGNTRAKSETGSGSFAIPLKEDELSYNFYQSRRPSFFLNFRKANQATLKVFDKTLLYRSLGSTYRGKDKTTKNLNIYKGFDGYIYIPEISASFREKRKIYPSVVKGNL